MKRFLKIFALLIISLFVLVSGVNATLDRLSHSATQTSFTLYNPKGDVVLAYTGELSQCRIYARPGLAVAPSALHRS